MHIMPRLLMLCALLLPLFSGCSKSGPSALSPGYTDAVELKLKSRELAEQMLGHAHGICEPEQYFAKLAHGQTDG